MKSSRNSFGMMFLSRFIILQSVVTRYLFVQKVVNCCKICKEYQLKLALWLLDMNNEDNWKDFQPEWLNQCDSELLQRIAENKQWCFKIATIIKKEYLERKIDEGVIEKYFRYFA